MSRHVSGGLCSMKTGAVDGCPLSNDATPTVRCRGVSPASDRMNGTSIEINGAEQKRTLGEILACCQVTYGAILKLEEKFDMLQAKGANIQTLHENPSALLSQVKSVGKSERKVFLPYSVLHKAGKMTRPSAAVRYILRNMFTTEELSQSSISRNPTRRLKRLDPNKISAIREWAGKRYPKFDFREKGKEWKICLSVINSMARYFRFVGKTQKQKLNATKMVSSKVEVTPAGTAEIDVELSDSDTEQKPQEMQGRKINSISHCDRPDDMNYNRAEYDLVYIGSSHREVKVPESALTSAHMRKRPELIARYLIKFIFPEDLLVRSSVYGARTGMDPLDHNKISALREHLSEHFPWMKLEEDGCDWKVCVGAINSTIRKCRFERKMGIKRGKC